MRVHIGFWFACATMLVGVQQVSAQQLSSSAVGPVRACVVKFLQEYPENACVSLEQFQRDRAALAECQGVPEPPASRHYCGVCFLTAGSVIPGCGPLLAEMPATPNSPQPPPPPVMDGGVEEHTPNPTPPAMDAGAPTVPPPSDAASAPAAAAEPTTLTGESVCRTLGGTWDATTDVPMERGRIQHGICLLPETQMLARMSGGFSRNAEPTDVMRGLASQTDRPIRESAARALISESEQRSRAHMDGVATQISRNEMETTTLLTDSMNMTRRSVEQSQRWQNIVREHLGLNLVFYGGLSPVPLRGYSPGFVGVSPELSFPVAPYWSGVIGFGLGLGVPDPGRIPATFHLSEMIGVRYQSRWVHWVDPARPSGTGNTAFAFAFGAAAYQHLHPQDWRVFAHTVGAFVEPSALLAGSGARFRIGMRAILGPSYRIVDGGQRGGYPFDVTVMLVIGPEFR